MKNHSRKVNTLAQIRTRHLSLLAPIQLEPIFLVQINVHLSPTGILSTRVHSPTTST